MAVYVPCTTIGSPVPNPVIATGGLGAFVVGGLGEVVVDGVIVVVDLIVGAIVASDVDVDDPWNATTRPVTAATMVAAAPT